MALLRAFTAGITGLKAMQTKVDIVGDNLANVSTTAFKETRIGFGELLAQKLTYGSGPTGFIGGVDPIQLGSGTKITGTSKVWKNGSLTSTGIATDLAIDGDGFFILTDATGGKVYTRDGSFSLNPEGLLHDSSTGYYVQGYQADFIDFSIPTGGVLTTLEIPLGALNIASQTENATFDGNLNAGGASANSGSQWESQIMYNVTTGDAADDTTLLSECGIRDDQGVLIDWDLNIGDVIEVEMKKGGASVTAEFTVGGAPPYGGTTLAELRDWIEIAMGVNSSPGMYSAVRGASDSVDSTVGDAVTLNTLTEASTSVNYFRDGVRIGDYIRFTTGDAAGTVSRITGVTATGLTFEDLPILPDDGSRYIIQRAAGMVVPTNRIVGTFDGVGDSITAVAPGTGGAESVTLTSDYAGFPGTAAIGDYIAFNGSTYRLTAVGVGTVTFDAGAGEFTPGQILGAAGTGQVRFGIVDGATGERFGRLTVLGNAGDTNNLTNIRITQDAQRLLDFDFIAAAEGESAATSTLVYDSLGSPHEVRMTWYKQGGEESSGTTWRWMAECDDNDGASRMVGQGTIYFDEQGQFDRQTQDDVSIGLNASGAQTPLFYTPHFNEVTSFAAANSGLGAMVNLSEVAMIEQDGYEEGELVDFSVETKGFIQGIFSNGLTRTLGQVLLTSFANQNGLQQLPSNYYRQGINSGIENTGPAGQFGRGLIFGGYLEESNVDLSLQFTELISGQRAFQANARTITVADRMLQELVNLI